MNLASRALVFRMIDPRRSGVIVSVNATTKTKVIRSARPATPVSRFI